MSALAHGWHPSEGSVAKIPVKVAKDFHAADAGHKYGKGMHKGDKTKKALHTARKYSKKAEGGEVDDDNTPDPFAAEKFIAPSVADQTALMAGKDVQTVKGIGNALAHTADLPRQAIEASAEDVQHLGEKGYDPKSIAPTTEAAMNVIGGAGVVPAEANALRTGVGLASKTADKTSFEKFLKQELSGAKPQQNYTQTGWYRGDDGAPRYWIDDKGARLKDENLYKADNAHGEPVVLTHDPAGMYSPSDREGVELGDVWDHDELYKAHPWLKNMPVVQHPTEGGLRGYYDALSHEIHVGELSPQDFHETLHHEAIHAIQHEEGFTGGGNAEAFLPDEFHEKRELVHDLFRPIAEAMAEAGTPIWGLTSHAMSRLAFRNVSDLSPYEQSIRQNLRSRGYWDQFVDNAKGLNELQAMQTKAHQDYLHIAGESEARDAPYIHRNPQALKPWQIPIHLNPELKRNKAFSIGQTLGEHFPPPSSRWGEGGAGGELPEGFIPDGVFEPGDPDFIGSFHRAQGADYNKMLADIEKRHFAHGGRVEAEKALPANHQLGMKVPKGGSMCANCKFLASPTTCGNKGFIEWNGKPELPAPADEYCCDLYGHDKPEHKAEGGGTRFKDFRQSDNIEDRRKEHFRSFPQAPQYPNVFDDGTMSGLSWQSDFAPTPANNELSNAAGANQLDDKVEQYLAARQAKGGKVAKKEEDPKDHEFINFAKGGLINSDIPGRTDKIPMKVPPGSYVLPADIPSALGQGNTSAGSEILSKMFTHSAYGLKPMTQKGSRFTYPSFPTIGHSIGKAEGGRTNSEHVPIIAAGGEYIIHPDVVKAVGHGDISKGHEVLDRFVLRTRKEHIKTLKGLKGPKQ